jgi:hypothetical protein
MLNMVNVYTRECAGLLPAVRLRSDDVVATHKRLRDELGIPTVI